MPMPLNIQLLGSPQISRGPEPAYRFRSRKSWAILAYLILTERPPSRGELAELFFSQADDPLRALRWNLSEIRRGLGHADSVSGDPVVIDLPAGAAVDVAVLAEGSLPQILDTACLGSPLLDGVFIRGSAAFESWLLSKRYQVASATESILHEAALVSLSRSDYGVALDYAVRAAAMSPFDENHQELLIRIYRLAGDVDAATRQYDAWKSTLQREFDALPSEAVESALSDALEVRPVATDSSSVSAMIESGLAAVSAGAVDAGIKTLRLAVVAADDAGHTHLASTARLSLGETLVHSLRGHDEEGLALLHSADQLSTANGDPGLSAKAKAEIGFVSFLRARYDRAEHFLKEAADLDEHSASLAGRVKAYLGAVEHDRGNYRLAASYLAGAVELSREAGEPRTEAYALSLRGRSELFRGSYDAAAASLDASISLTMDENWLGFLPWPQALRGEVQLARGDLSGASLHLNQAFARACQIGDTCWEGTAARGIGLLAEAQGETETAFETLADALKRCNRLQDPYVWLEAYILDAQCTLGRKHGHPDTAVWIDRLREISSRTGMKELTVRALVHSAALNRDGDFAAAQLLAIDIDNPVLDALLDSVRSKGGILGAQPQTIT